MSAKGNPREAPILPIRMNKAYIPSHPPPVSLPLFMIIAVTDKKTVSIDRKMPTGRERWIERNLYALS